LGDPADIGRSVDPQGNNGSISSTFLGVFIISALSSTGEARDNAGRGAACREWGKIVHLLRVFVLLFVVLALETMPARSEDLACLSTTFRFLGANDKVCVSAFDDPKVPGVACHISQARTGGVKGSLGLAEDPSRFSVACRQVGPVTVDITKLPEEESAYSERTSIFFKHTQVFRMVDKKRNTLVYIAISDKIVEGSPQNSISTVPIMSWGH
jgi:CreA protein